MRILSIMYLDVLVWGSLEGVLDQVMVVLEDHIQVVVVLHVLDVVREYTFICVEIKSVSVSETFISWSFTRAFPLTLCVLINKKGVDRMTFRLTGKCPRQNLKTKLTWFSGGSRRSEAPFFRFSIWISKRFLVFLTSRLLSVWLYSSYFLNHLPLS